MSLQTRVLLLLCLGWLSLSCAAPANAVNLPDSISSRLPANAVRLQAIACALDQARDGELAQVAALIRRSQGLPQLIDNLRRLRPALARDDARRYFGANSSFHPRLSLAQWVNPQTSAQTRYPNRFQTPGSASDHAAATPGVQWLTSTTADANKGAQSSQRVWLQLGLDTGEQDDNDDLNGFDADGRSLAVGWDWQRHDLALGVSLGQTSADVDSRRLGSDELTGTQIQVNTARNIGQHRWSASIGYARSETERERLMLVQTLAGDRAFTLFSDIDATQLSLNLGWSTYFSITENFSVSPYVGVSVNRLKTDDYEEIGGGNLSLAVATKDIDQNIGSLGLSASYVIFTGDWLVSPSLQLGFEHDFKADAMQSTSRFRNTDFRFGTQGFSVEENRFRVGFALQLLNLNGLGLSLAVDTQRKNDYAANSVMLSIEAEL